MTTLGKYELITPLGEGATSEVYRARDTALGRDVALKVLKPSLVADSSAFERFAREAQAAAGLFHPNIATVLDMGEADGRYFIAMRYFEGKALDKVLREDGPLTWDETLRLLGQIGSALDHAHKKGFLHRDVKPGNIIREENGDFILTDFGLTSAMMSTGLTSHTGAVLGTPAYIAPEVWNGEAAAPATDQYALACVLYECLTGTMLFEGDTPLALMKKVFDGPQLPAAWPPGVPAGIEPVLQRALSAKPDERHPSLAAFEQACRALAEKPAALPKEEKAPPPAPAPEPVFEPPYIPPPPAKKGSYTWLWVLGGVVGLVVFGYIGILVLSRLFAGTNSGSLANPPAATQALATPTPPTLGIGSTMVSDKDGMVLVYVPAGEFTMGSNGGDDDEKPVHTVTLDAFWIDQTEVTNAMFEKFAQATGWQTEAEKQGASHAFDPDTNNWEFISGANWRHPQGPNSNLSGLANHPVVHVSWNDAQAYCEWAGRRLPTEAEWEKAARGTDERVYPWGNQPPVGDLVNFADVNLDVDWADKSENDGYQLTAPIGSYPDGASPYGALDMAGNAWEWVADWYDADYYSNAPAENPTGPSSGNARVLRGGSWNYVDYNIRSADRYWGTPDVTYDLLGFRCLRSP